MPTRVRAYPDTNVFLHWAPFWELDWRAILGAGPEDEVEIVVASVVLYELEKHKDRHAKGAVRRRALGTVRELEARGAEAPEGTALGGGLRIRVLFDAAPPEGSASEVLAKEVADDRIVAAMMRARDEEAWDRVVVLTADIALRMKARAHGFAAVTPPEASRERDEAEETELETARRGRDEAQRERDELARARPSLRVCLDGGEERSEIELRQRAEYPIDFSERLFYEGLKDTTSSVEQRGMHTVDGVMVSASTAEEYDEDVEEYHAAWGAYIEALLAHEERAALTARIVLRVTNVGTETAREASVRVGAFGEGAPSLGAAEHQAPVPPKPPDKPTSYTSMKALNAIARTLVRPEVSLLARLARAAEGGAPHAATWSIAEDGRLEAVVPILRPDHSIDLPPLYAEFPSVAEGGGTVAGEARIVAEALADRMPRAQVSTVTLAYTLVPRPLKPPSRIDKMIAKYADGKYDFLGTQAAADEPKG